MAFIPVNDSEGQTVDLQVGATTFTKGDACIHDAFGQMVKATPGNGTAIRYVIAEDVLTTATAGDLHLFWVATRGVKFIADTTATPTQAQMGTSCDIVTNAGTLDTATVADTLFFLERPNGPLADKSVIGSFNVADPLIEGAE